MQITNSVHMPVFSQAYGTTERRQTPEVQSESTSEEYDSLSALARSIDPTDMTRKDAFAIGDALARSGDHELGMLFIGHSLTLGTLDEQGQYRPPTQEEHDTQMQERFNLVERVQGELAFAQSHGAKSDHYVRALEFLDHFQHAGQTEEINSYA